MAIYEISNLELCKFGVPGRPFLPFDCFCALVRQYRDEHFAAEGIENFVQDIGVKYNLWTSSMETTYSKNVIFDDVCEPLRLSFMIPKLDSRVTFPLEIELYGDSGVYFTQRQIIAVQGISEGSTKLTSWRRIKELREFVEAQSVEFF